MDDILRELDDEEIHIANLMKYLKHTQNIHNCIMKTPVKADWKSFKSSDAIH